MTPPSIEARVGARWWANKIRDGFRPDAGAQKDDPINSEGARELIQLNKNIDARTLTWERIDVYEQVLAQEIQGMLDAGDSSYTTALKLGCDYGPSEAHRTALEAAGIRISLTILPWKTAMWVQPGSVKVGDGYGAEPESLPLEVPA